MVDLEEIRMLDCHDHAVVADGVPEGGEVPTSWELARSISSWIRPTEFMSAQETFVRLWQSRETWRSTGSVRALLYRVARNLALNEERSRRIRSQRSYQVAEAQGSRVWVRTPAEGLQESERRRMLDEAIAMLPRRRREILRQVKLRGRSYREVAQLLDISQQTVANQLSAALSSLREALQLSRGREAGSAE